MRSGSIDHGVGLGLSVVMGAQRYSDDHSVTLGLVVSTSSWVRSGSMVQGDGLRLEAITQEWNARVMSKGDSANEPRPCCQSLPPAQSDKGDHAGRPIPRELRIT